MRPLNYDDIDFLKKLQTDMNTSGLLKATVL